MRAANKKKNEVVTQDERRCSLLMGRLTFLHLYTLSAKGFTQHRRCKREDLTAA